MSGKIINTLRYGNARTKRGLYLMFGIGAAAVVCAILAFVFGNAVLGIGAAAAAVIDGLVIANKRFSDRQVRSRRSPERKRRTAARRAVSRSGATENASAEEPEEEVGALQWVSGKKRAKQEPPLEEEALPEEASPEERPAGRQGVRAKTKKNPLLTYDAQKLKTVMVTYKASRGHVPIMIDSCQKERIEQCPAYLWKDTTYAYFLLLEENPRMVKCLLRETQTIRIRRGVPAYPVSEYPDMKERSLVSQIFSPYLPNYYHGGGGGFLAEYRKNLYCIGPGIWCTAASVPNILNVLPSDFVLEDSKVNSDAYSSYFRDIYVARVLYRDSILSAADYKDRVQGVLAALSDADIAENVFHEYLAQMVVASLIPQDYADYAVARRGQKQRKGAKGRRK